MPPFVDPALLIQHAQQWFTSAAIVTRLVGLAAMLLSSRWYYSQPYHTSKCSGLDWVNELIRGNPGHIYSELGVSLQIFVLLIIELRKMGYTASNKICDP
ncbi:putative transposase [Mycena kentingensis (nom. inval.)]|nr:putative transposase [Mycena kentingensis (nom. inval.)]